MDINIFQAKHDIGYLLQKSCFAAILCSLMFMLYTTYNVLKRSSCFQRMREPLATVATLFSD